MEYSRVRVVVRHWHFQPRASAGARPLRHFLVADRIAERRVRPTAGHYVDTLDFANRVAVGQKFRFLDWERLASDPYKSLMMAVRGKQV